MVSRKYLSETALPELHGKVRKHIFEEIKDAKVISFTTDIWSSDVSPMSLLSLTAHWLDEGFEPHSAMLNATNFRGSHTSDAIAASLKEMFEKWQIPQSKVHVVLRDNASNMRKAMDNMGVRSVGCVAHTMQLVVNEGLLSQRAVSDAVACGRQIVGHFKRSPLAYSRLQDIQVQMNMQPKRLQQDVKTRWNSTYYLIESLIEQKRALSAYSADHELPTTPTANQWALLEKTMICLEPFEEFTRKVSSATASTADVVPSVTVLKRLLSMETEADSGIKTMKKSLLAAVDKRFSTVEDEPLYALSTLLDPRYKDRFFTSADSAKRGKDALAKELEEDLRSTTDGAAKALEPPGKALRVEAAAPALSSNKSSSFMREFDKIRGEREEEPGAASSSSSAVQLHGYFTEETIPTTDDPFKYWRVNRQRFPGLAASALKYLCAPCTSVESERLFSTVSTILDEKRNRLTAERAEMLAFLNKNLPVMLKAELEKLEKSA
ncbi:zinc finger BED domain-containing protein 4-like [Melanotaenia boesemani]|uniref:zinc finger BED domain-containing protein 4-like n=1 Tax=Melanotaenia boesemani TaxID=1250792 RepID=UPI001C04F264|nr:zinc finger BED domain-containing protein 4-like [Melanotaenia boesemani]